MWRRVIIISSLAFLFSRFWLLLLVFCWLVWQQPNTNFPTLMSQWDSGWYLSIIDAGYDKTNPGGYTVQQNWAFFPLYPLLAYLVTAVTPLWKEYASLLITQFSLLGAMIVGCKYYLETRQDAIKSTPTTNSSTITSSLTTPLLFLLGFGFSSFYYSLIYTEALFLFLTATGFLFLHRRWYWRAALIGVLLSATRNVGFLFGLIIVWQFLADHWHHQSSIRTNLRLLLATHGLKLVGFLVTASSGLIMFMLYLLYRTGDGLAWLRVQSAWGRTFFTYLSRLHADYTLAEMWWLGGAVLVAAVILLWAIRDNRRLSEILFALIVIVIPLATALWSFPRYLAGCFPFLCLLADCFIKLPHRYYKYVIWALLAVLNGVMLFAWLGQNRIAM